MSQRRPAHNVSAQAELTRLRHRQARTLEFMASSVERMAAGRKGTLGNWSVRQTTRYNEGLERQTVALRAQDLVANDPYAASAINSLVLNTVGKGFTPQAQPLWERLGITEDEAQQVAKDAEWAWQVWDAQADAGNRLTFGDIQYLNLRSMLVNGEFVNLPVMLKDPGRRYSLALQVLDPLRLRTPFNRVGDRLLRDGIELGQRGEPQAYWIADPHDGYITPSLLSFDYRRVPARLGHRPGIFHEFHQVEPEQVRGMSILAPVMKTFKDLFDYLDYELVGAIIAAAFPVVIKQTSLLPGPKLGGENKIYDKIEEIVPGMVANLPPGWDMSVLENKRPSGTAEVFIRTVLRAIGAGTGQPYEVFTKDFSQMNYSSARAALLEVWRLYTLYRHWMLNHFCQPVWVMVFEEAWLRGDIRLPKGKPGFYEATAEWTAANWTFPPRGHVDPTKEMEAAILGMANHLLTRQQIVGEQGGDWRQVLQQANREQKEMTALGLNPAPVFTPKQLMADENAQPGQNK